MFSEDVLADLRNSEASRRAGHDAEVAKALASLDKALENRKAADFGGIFLFGFLVGFMFAALAGRLVP